MFKEFKAFALKGNVLELAVAVVLGAAFGKIIASLVADIIMPVIGLIFGNTDFASNWVYKGIKYGLFVQSIIDFIIVAFAIFMFIQIINKLTKAQPTEETVEENVQLLTEIRDLLRK
ncbi:large conductance mechanosensitive channel protein MscL [Macrococcus capreoli]|uniref:large conductance mechanosensitive channel protein MscL n=1 Tax=Macrococcus capreoli TaxID=2982690 RepID=UPI0021D59DA1|nr:large conductance mechanosensitive channel protein MscL [Macrococcus sp. TMW 2.2395]MCU7556338.1 large conductance mechanosensitive channel protein MscL [Macrococcus sp. TMW 2.2395]